MQEVNWGKLLFWQLFFSFLRIKDYSWQLTGKSPTCFCKLATNEHFQHHKLNLSQQCRLKTDKESDTSKIYQNSPTLSTNFKHRFWKPQNTLGCFKKYTRSKVILWWHQLIWTTPWMSMNKIRLQNNASINHWSLYHPWSLENKNSKSDIQKCMQNSWWWFRNTKSKRLRSQATEKIIKVL